MEQGTWVTLIPVIVVANKPQQLRSWYTAIGVYVCACGTSAKDFSLTQLPSCPVLYILHALEMRR